MLSSAGAWQEKLRAEMDRIFFTGMEFFGYHGVYPQEKSSGQKFLVDLSLEVDLAKAGHSDALEDTIDYSEVQRLVQGVVEGKRYNLLEALAGQIATVLLEAFPALQAVTVQVEKPQAPLPGTWRSVGVEIHRSRGELTWRSGVYVGLGSNLGDREANLCQALKQLSSHPRIAVIRVSPWYETAPVGVTDQGWFLNAVAELTTSLDPRELLEEILRVEAALGRVRTRRWGPRAVDLDLLLYQDQKLEEPGLEVPHPRLEERVFVIKPLSDLAPDLRLPSGITAKERLASLPSGPDCIRRYRVDTNC